MSWSLIVMPVEAGRGGFDRGRLDSILGRFEVGEDPYGLVLRKPNGDFTQIDLSADCLSFDRPGGEVDFRLIWEILESCRAFVFNPSDLHAAVASSEMREAMPKDYPARPYVASDWRDLMDSSWDTDGGADQPGKA